MATETGSGILIVTHDVEIDDVDAFDRWYEEDHIPANMTVPGVLAARRFHIDAENSRMSSVLAGRSQPPRRYVTIYELDEPGVVESVAWQELRTRYSDISSQMFAAMRDVTRAAYRLHKAY